MEIGVDGGDAGEAAEEAAGISADGPYDRSVGRLCKPPEPRRSTRTADRVAWDTKDARSGLGLERFWAWGEPKRCVEQRGQRPGYVHRRSDAPGKGATDCQHSQEAYCPSRSGWIMFKRSSPGLYYPSFSS